MKKEIVFSGFGGQGVLTAGLILANAANDCGKQVLWLPAYGGQMRGGKSYSLVKYSDTPICHPDMEALDILVAMNLPSLTTYAGRVKEQGLILIDSDTVPEDAPVPTNKNVRIFYAPLETLARKADNPKGANITALGILLQLEQLFSYDVFEKSLLQYFEQKGKAAYALKNAAALRQGYDYAAK